MYFFDFFKGWNGSFSPMSELTRQWGREGCGISHCLHQGLLWLLDVDCSLSSSGCDFLLNPFLWHLADGCPCDRWVLCSKRSALFLGPSATEVSISQGSLLLILC